MRILVAFIAAVSHVAGCSQQFQRALFLPYSQRANCEIRSMCRVAC